MNRMTLADFLEEYNHTTTYSLEDLAQIIVYNVDIPYTNPLKNNASRLLCASDEFDLALGEVGFEFG